MYEALLSVAALADMGVMTKFRTDQEGENQDHQEGENRVVLSTNNPSQSWRLKQFIQLRALFYSTSSHYVESCYDEL